jgi:HEAT repeat protein
VRRSWRTQRQSIESTLRELLRETDMFVLYAAEPAAAQRLAAVWVYPRGSTRDIEPVPVELWASTRELRHQLTEWDPDLRGRAIEELIARGGDTALPQVFEALADGNADIRQRALDAALAAGLDVPLEQLHALVLNDPSPEVRVRALQALEERPDSQSTLEAAAQDTDANVRREAQNILRRVTHTPR